jgi:uncharacterized protein involved in exopolysaccharide biosynthesis
MLTIHVHHHFHLPDLEALMSELADKINAVSAAADQAIARVAADVEALKAQIADLEGKVVTAEDQAALDALKAKLDALDPVPGN